MKKIEEKELQSLQTLNVEFNKLKTNLGDLALQKHGICLRVEELKTEFSHLERDLMTKYGKDAVINLETGEIKEKEEPKEKE
ncbi:MAG: hypothetical protein GY760_22325 [Deltaproteobacteria bacterium]|jgi:phage host-nuclease inhibitor protein Gam|nr:hypothetical protein [Deltaproteobacteria bacterium]